MKYNQNLYHHRSIHLKEYDYSQAGMYFIPICTHNHQYFFREIVEEKMYLNNGEK